MYNSQYYTCEQIDQRLLQGYLDDYNSQNDTNLTKEQFLTLLHTILTSGLTIGDIVQVLGNNTNKIMSQKSVTDEIYKATDGRIKDIEDDFAIAGNNSYAIVIFKNGHVFTKNFSSQDTVSQIAQMIIDIANNKNAIENMIQPSGSEDFNIRDERANAIVLFKDGHIFTKNFSSDNIIISECIEDFAIQDPYNNAIVLFKDGHIFTKNFSSQNIISQIAQMILAIASNKNAIEDMIQPSGSEDFNIQDGKGNAIVLFKDGHIFTKNFSSDEIKVGEGSDEDFAIQDPYNNAIVIFKDGHIFTKKFSSDNILIDECVEDFSVSDSHNNSIVLFKDGHIFTKNFSSDEIKVSDFNVDFSVLDPHHNAIVVIEDGYPKTKNFDGKEVKKAAIGSENTGLVASGDYRGYKIVTAGQGRDFPTIQEAINSITDASVNNQYIVLVYDNYYVDDVTQLWKWSNRNQRISSIDEINNGETCAYIFTKDYVHIVGKGQVTIHVNYPTNLINNSNRQYVKETSEDYCAVKKFINLECIYIGDENNSYQHAFGVGTANGLHMDVINCKFIGKNGARSGYFHTHSTYKFPVTINFINCLFEEDNIDGNFTTADLFSGQNNRVNVEGCEFKHLSVSYGINQPVYVNTDFDIRHTRFQIHGHRNRMRMGREILPVLRIVANNYNEQFTDVSGTAFDALFIDCLKTLQGTAGNKAVWVGCRAAMYSENNTWNANYSSLGYNLGDCSVNNKALSITIGGHTETVVFDKNYGGLSGTTPTANYSDADIIDEINSQLSYCQISKNFTPGIVYFDDEVDYVYNNSSERIDMGKFVVKDHSVSDDYKHNAIKLTSENDVIYGIAAEPIDPHGYGYIILRGKSRIWTASGTGFGLGNFNGKLLKAGNNGTIVETQNKGEAYLYGTDNQTIDWI